MSPGNRPTGRQKRIVSGSGTVKRRGSGLGGGPVGGYSRPSAGGGSISGGTGGDRSTRSGGGSLLAILAAILIGKAAAGGGGNGNGGNNRSGCLKRILILVVIIAVGSWLLKTCAGSSLLSSYGGSGYSGGSTLNEVVEEPTAAPVQATAAPVQQSVFSMDGATAPVTAATQNAFAAYEPDYSVANAARQRYTSLKGNGSDTATIMIYMCGADLESKSGMGTADLQEMVGAQISDNVNILVETGGASYWQNQIVSNKTNQIYQIRSGGLKRLESNLGKQSMVDPATLAQFIQYCQKNFPADRYGLILWDHGGGSLSGYGYDEFVGSGDTMTIDEINTALRSGGCRFDFIGFDACLMATLETALVLEPYADYMIASEATEPGTGWYYTNWISNLSDDPSMATVDLGKTICDDFVKVSQQMSSSSAATLSLIDLAELSGTVPAAFTEFSNATSALISSDGYQQVASARSGARDFSVSTRINQIDLIHFAENLGTAESGAFANVLRGCVKYNRASSNITHANGVSIYFPYNSLSSVSTAVNTYEKIGLDESYTSCIKSFASMAAGGSFTSGGSGNALGSLMGESSYGSLLGQLLGGSSGTSASYEAPSSSSGSYDTVASLLDLFLSSSNKSVVTGDRDNSWIDSGLLQSSVASLEKNRGGFDNLVLTEKNGQRVLEMSEEQWGLVQMLEQNVFFDDGTGYVDLGLDNVFTWNDEGDLVMDYDGTWMSLNGQVVSYYFVSQDQVDDAVTIVGRVPAMLTHTVREGTETVLPVEGEGAASAGNMQEQTVTDRVNLILIFDDETPYGRVAGAQIDPDAEGGAIMKGLLPLEKGDALSFLSDYYGYDGTYQDTYYLNEPMTVTGEWEIGNVRLSGGTCRMMYRITDLYGAHYWTPAA